MQNDVVGQDTEKNPEPEFESTDWGWDHEVPLKIITLYFESPATQNVEEAHETLTSWSSTPPLLIAESMFVADDHVPDV